MAMSSQSLSKSPSGQRRALVLSGLAGAALLGVAPVGRLGATPASGISVQAFLQLSAVLVHRPANSLNQETAQRVLEAFLAQGKQEALIQLAQNPSLNTALAADIRAAWFSGLVPGAGPAPVTYSQALIWSAAPFLHVPGTCGGPTGYWAQPPNPT